jgi:hypothetical protein
LVEAGIERRQAREGAMKVTLQIRKNGISLYEGVYDIVDPDSFGQACADAWIQLKRRQFGTAPNVGALMDVLDQSVLEELQGADIRVTKG